MPFKSVFFIFEKWSQVGTKIVLEIDVNFERPIFTKTYKHNKKHQCFCVNFGTHVESQNALKIILKIYSKIECVLALIFLDFVRFGEASWGRNGSKNRCKNAPKNDANSDAFWMRLGWVFRRTRHGDGSQPPPLLLCQKKNTVQHKLRDELIM